MGNALSCCVPPVPDEIQLLGAVTDCRKLVRIVGFNIRLKRKKKALSLRILINLAIACYSFLSRRRRRCAAAERSLRSPIAWIGARQVRRSGPLMPSRALAAISSSPWAFC